MKVLLVYPKYPDSFMSFKYALPFINKKAANPPLGLLTVAAMLPAAWEKRLIDMNAKKDQRRRPDVGRLRVHQRHEHPKSLGQGDPRPLPGPRREDRGRGAAVHHGAGGVPRGRPPGAGRGGDHPGALPQRPGAGHGRGISTTAANGRP